MSLVIFSTQQVLGLYSIYPMAFIFISLLLKIYILTEHWAINRICRGVHFVKISEPAARTQYGVSFTPQLVFFKNGSPKYFEGEYCNTLYSTGGEFVVLIVWPWIGAEYTVLTIYHSIRCRVSCDNCVSKLGSRVLCTYYIPQLQEQMIPYPSIRSRVRCTYCVQWN